MLGFVEEEDKAVLMKSAEIFCYPSLYEGFGIPILEAMNIGVPVIASDIPAHKEIAENAVIYFDSEDSEDLSKKIVQIMEDKNLKNDLIEKGKIQAQKFSWTKTAGKTLGIFESMS